MEALEQAASASELHAHEVHFRTVAMAAKAGKWMQQHHDFEGPTAAQMAAELAQEKEGRMENNMAKFRWMRDHGKAVTTISRKVPEEENRETQLRMLPSGGLTEERSSRTSRTSRTSRESGEEQAPVVAGLQAQERASKMVLKGHHGPVVVLSVCKTGKYALSASGDSTLKMWDLTTMQCMRTFTGHRFGVHSVAVDGRVAVSAGGAGPDPLRVWDLQAAPPPGASCQCQRQTTEPAAADSVVALTNNGRIAFSVAPRDGRLMVWDVATGHCQETVQLQSRSSGILRMCEDNKTLIVGLDNGVMLVFDLLAPSLEVPRLVLDGHITKVTAAAVTPDSSTLVSGSMSGSLAVWDLKTGMRIAKLDGNKKGQGHAARVCDVVISADGKLVISGGADGTMRAWDVRQGKSRVIQGKPPGGLFSASFWVSDTIPRVALSPDASKAITASSDFALRVWDLASGACLSILRGHHDEVTALSVLAGGRTLISASMDGSIRLWDI